MRDEPALGVVEIGDIKCWWRADVCGRAWRADVADGATNVVSSSRRKTAVADGDDIDGGVVFKRRDDGSW